MVTEYTSHLSFQHANSSDHEYCTSALLDVSNATNFQVSNLMFRLQNYVTIITLHKQYSNLNCNSFIVIKSACQQINIPFNVILC